MIGPAEQAKGEPSPIQPPAIAKAIESRDFTCKVASVVRLRQVLEVKTLEVLQEPDGGPLKVRRICSGVRTDQQ